MKRIKMFFVLAVLSHMSWAQKKIEFDTLAKWPVIGHDAIMSNDARYVAYESRILSGGWLVDRKLVLKDITKNSETILNAKITDVVGFTNDNNFFLYRNGSDSICAINLLSSKSRYITNVDRIVIPKGNYSDRALYSTRSGDLVFAKISGSKPISLGRVNSFELANNNVDVIICSSVAPQKERLVWVDLLSLKVVEIASGGTYPVHIWTDSHRDLVFLERTAEVSKVKWFKKDKTGVSEVFSDKELNGRDQLNIEGINRISGNVESIELSLVKLTNPFVATGNLPAKVKIWSYTDVKRAPEKPLIPKSLKKFYKALLFTSSGKIKMLEANDLKTFEINNGWYSCSMADSSFLLSATNGEIKILKNLPSKNTIENLHSVSTDGNSLIYPYGNRLFRYDVKKQSAMSIDLQTIGKDTDSSRFSLWQYLSVANDVLLVMDKYDVWSLDVNGRRKPICLTNGYGEKNDIRFSFESVDGKPLYFNGKFLLKAFGTQNKKQGFFSCNVSNSQGLEKYTFSDNIYGTPKSSRDGKSWLVAREAIDASVNFFLTKNFKAFTPVSDNYPEKSYVWFTSEILDSSLPDGKQVQSILYKPKNFDPSKKYPVIINYYEGIADGKNTYLPPGYSGANINVPWFLSRGYLVLKPDIYYKLGFTGESAVACVNAAVDGLVKLDYVDDKKIGINGHSFGGFETFHIVTRTTRFAAALAEAGISNLVSFYTSEVGTCMPNGRTLAENQTERPLSFRIGATLWERPDRFVENTPVFYADKVKTPLLIMHNRNDGACPFQNGLDFFMSMRRLGKPSWLLEYEGEGHVIENIENLKDYTIRTTQFFDHYLKGAPAPLWMIEGQRYNDQKYTPGYELDSLNRKPGPGINSIEEQKKIDEYSKIPFSEKLRPLIEEKKK